VEAGTHRVTRIPPNEKNGRRHTSAVTVAVLSPIRLVDSGVNLRDVRIEAYKASGNGGQNRNKRETAIRVVHVPTGISAISAGERFKEVNQERALEVLSARVTAYNERKVTERYNTLKAKMHGSGHIAERQRSYLWREGVAVDHQTGVRVNLKDALNGNLELFTKE
jgi:peptide chain release factor 1